MISSWNYIESNALLFADDMKISRKITSTADCLRLQTDLNIIHNWCLENKLTINVSKCSTVTFTRKQTPIVHPYAIGDQVLVGKTEHNDLGVIYETDLKFKKHIKNTTNKASRMIGFILKNTKTFTDTFCLVALYNSLVKSLLDYCPPI